MDRIDRAGGGAPGRGLGLVLSSPHVEGIHGIMPLSGTNTTSCGFEANTTTISCGFTEGIMCVY